MSTTGIINNQKVAFFIIDIQEKLTQVVRKPNQVFKNVNRLIHSATILKIPVFITEQYPKGLGVTCAEIDIPEWQHITEKLSFSCLKHHDMVAQLHGLGVTDIVLTGVEAHVCVLKTALDGVEEGFTVHVVADAVSSRTKSNKELALARLRQSGVFIVSTEMLLFQLMEEAGTEDFKKISKLIK